MQKPEYLYKAANHAANLNEMRLKDKWCDLTIKVNQKEIRVHKVILAANLKYFDAMLSNESFQESKQGFITMESVEERDLEEFVAYAYTGEILLTDSNALNLLELANYLGEDGIKEACIEFLQKHLKAEEACRAYKFANSVDCQLLKNAAKAKITKNFEDCSSCADYFDFDYKSLINILSDSKTETAQMQQMLFEGIMRWILHDAQCRKIHVNDLLSSIDMVIFKTDYLMKYMHENLTGTKDDYLAHDIILNYQTSKSKQKAQESLVIVNASSFLIYNFSEKKWSSLEEISLGGGSDFYFSSATFNDKLYYTTQNVEVNHLQVFDPITKHNTTFHSLNNILRFTAICPCTKFIYLCGGMHKDESDSNQVVRYEPETNSLVALVPMKTRRRFAAAIFYLGYLYVSGGFNDDCENADQTPLNSVEIYDPATKQWTDGLRMQKNRWCHALAILNGKLYACGGYPEDRTVEFYDSGTNSWQVVASMNRGRYDFIVVAYESKLLAIGGDDESTVEVYDPIKDHWQIDRQMSSGLQINHPSGGLISNSYIVDKK